MLLPKVRVVTGDLATNAQLTIGPFKKGLGKTIGFALRRVLLALTSGTAVTQVSIEGTTHPLSSVYGVVEDVPQLVMNVRQVIFQTHENTMNASITKDTPGIIRANDIWTPSSSRIINPNLVIGHLTAGRINIRMRVQKGWGYVSKINPPQPNNTVFLDPVFSPVKGVSYSVVPEGTGNLAAERLVLGIQTDGSVSPVEAVKQAVDVLKTQLSFLGPSNNET